MKLTKRMRDPMRIKSSPFISDQEYKFVKFCQENGINTSSVSATDDAPANNKRIRAYHVAFEPKFLDDLERKVVAFCDENHIAYTFVRDNDGTHHYSFSGFIDLGGYTLLENTYVNLDRILWQRRQQGVQPRIRQQVAEETGKKKASVWSRLTSLFRRKKLRREPSEMDLFYESLGMDRYTLLSLSLPFDDPEEFDRFYTALLKEEEKKEQEAKDHDLRLARAKHR